ncbi:glycosyltransferase [Psychroflexus sp. CAK57W]|uniref:glycosyltransferase n=1 Tax=Psychroflexus curvus TaxID=2873595 RepID=UPI001CCF2407|nr:glycosyltransferase [Psychroflexus curvus]MBZ9787856.1 glycosyltransferase [Psychroflexus curvus]
MKVLLVNTYDRGGAASASLRLHTGLVQDGIDSKVLLKNKQKKTPQTYTLQPQIKKLTTSQKIARKLKNILRTYGVLKKKPIPAKVTFMKNREKGLEFFSFPDADFDITSSQLYQEADIINLHWVADFLDFKSFFKKNTKPIVWTLHDMNPFTGGEHYEEEFLGMDKSGYPLKRIMSIAEKKISNENVKIKKQALDGVNNLTIVTPSVWLAEQARKSEVLNSMPIQCIPNGLDSEVFKPRDKNYSKSLLNIPENKKVILFVADSINNNRKGFVFLKQAFQQLQMDNVVLCAIGNKTEAFESIGDILELGPINDERLMSAAYSAADVFVIPSLMDNLPNTGLESLMCGTPVIGFPIGGIPDMIQDGENGLLAKEISVKALVESLNTFLNTVDNFDRKSIRDKAVAKYDMKIQANAYIDMFEHILKH